MRVSVCYHMSPRAKVGMSEYDSTDSAPWILPIFIYLETYFFVDESTMYIRCDQNKKLPIYQRCCLIMYLGSGLATSSQTVMSLLRTSWLALLAGKNDLNMGPILLNFIYLETYFFVDESTMYFGCNPDNKFVYPPEVLPVWVIMYLKGGVATSTQTVRSLLRTSWSAVPVGKMI
jgi:hypothetical protein